MLTTYLKDLPQQSVSSKKNLQVVDLSSGGRLSADMHMFRRLRLVSAAL